MSSVQKLKDLAVSDSGFVFDPYTGSTFSVNAAGRLILKGLADGLGREAIVASLEESFEVQGGDLPRDVDEFIHLLRESGLIPSDFSL